MNEQEKIGYNQFDSYPDGKGVENLRFVRGLAWSRSHGDFANKYKQFKKPHRSAQR